MYLSLFSHDVQHKPGKLHVIPDALSLIPIFPRRAVEKLTARRSNKFDGGEEGEMEEET